ncbi:M23 family metallopeptidase [Microbacterium sp. K27]|uniref:M23 family metallopeptidase n=1 Tax=Microbacterium sp. K27 TaxID=2305445 RepID=UPI00109BF0F1|nr:M23 family metallopeptidase [Microbacterium sp. K27]
MPFETSQAASAPTRRSSRLRTAASEAPAAGPTAPISAAESAAAPTAAAPTAAVDATAVALAAVAPLSRRAARQRPTADDVAAEPLVEPFIAPNPEQIIADVPDVPGDDADAFERASRAFRATGSVPTVSAADRARAQSARASDDEPVAAMHVAARRPRNIRKAVTLSATVGVMSLAGLLAVSMTLPAEAVAGVQGASAASMSLVSSSAGEAKDTAEGEIQAFVAPSGVESEALTRADDFSTVSLAEVAAEQGINYSGEIFTNDPDAAIQWPFLVGVGMSYGYGMRSGRLHEGIDFVPGNGAPIQAIADGTVRIATEQGGAFGVTVYIDHVIDGQVITSHYSHMQYGSLNVKAGDTVTVGTVVGKTGNTGRSYGAHLHFELIVNGSTIDPMPWLKENAGRTSY